MKQMQLMKIAAMTNIIIIITITTTITSRTN